MASVLGRMLYAVRVLRGFFGVHPRTCPACNFTGRFRAFGLPPRFDAECPKCRSLERHRLLVLADQRAPLVREGAELLHVAAEPIIRDRVKPRCKRYVTLDAHAAADVRAPLEATGLPDASFDHVICCHVLEHVDDRKALEEIRRILRPGGTLVAMVPIIEGWSSTYEDGAIASSAERELHFGQHDHVRFYGSDLRTRIRDAGFTLTEITAEGPDVVRYGLMRGEKLFIATKPVSS